MSQLGQNRKSSTRANVFCSSLNNGHQAHGYVRLVPIGGLVAFDRSGFSALEKLEFLRVNEAHRSGAHKRQRFDHPHPRA